MVYDTKTASSAEGLHSRGRLWERPVGSASLSAAGGGDGMSAEVEQAEETRVHLWSPFVSGEGDRPATYLQIVVCTWWIGRLVTGSVLPICQHTNTGE